MEVPKKIQIHFIKNDYDAWCIRGYSFLEDKQMGMVEYTRTDVFGEKAVSYLNSKLYDWVQTTNPNQRSHANTIMKQDFIEDFEEYLKK